MLIGGLQKTTLIDYPGKVACTVFTVGCNFRCPFCHNKDLVTLQLFEQAKVKPVKEKDFFNFLDKRKKILDGVCITGGEPTLQSDLPQFCQKIKKLKMLVKLDTNGTNPVMLEKLIKGKLIDFVAMDLKTNFSDYEKLVQLKVNNEKLIVKVKSLELIKRIKKSIILILKSGLEYEFRTTVVPGLHDQESLNKLAKELKREVSNVSKVPKVSKVSDVSKVNWFLQFFRPQNCLDKRYLKIKPYSSSEMNKILLAVQKILPAAKLRGTEE